MRFPKQESSSGWPCPSSGDLPNPGVEPGSPALAGRFFAVWATREALLLLQKLTHLFKSTFLYYWYKYFSLSFFFFPLDTLEIASVNLPIPVQTRNYYKNVSDNKEIVKLVSVLSTIINSTKKVCQEDLQPGYFALQHRPVWSPALKLALHVAWVPPSVTSVSNLWNLVGAQPMFNSRFFIPDCKVKENYLFCFFFFLILSPV